MTADLIVGSGGALAAIGMFLIGAYCHQPVEAAARWLLARLMPDQGAHSTPASEVERSFSREPITTPLLASEDATAHADAMHAASEEYLPPPPESHPYAPRQDWRSLVNAGRAVEPVRTGEHPPWTGEIPALTPEMEAAEQDRQRYIKAHLAEAAGMTDDEVRAAMRDALDSLRRPAVTESTAGWRPDAVTAEGERLPQVIA